ncbi:MAG: tetratricopeptide repeat protein [Myxococcales bacterium]|nr:tetratricopeptide repeat protein [Myxococcales bacterium]
MTQMDDKHSINFDSDDLVERAELYAYAQQFDLAEDEYREALAEDPNNADAYLGLIRMHFIMRDFDKAQAVSDEGLTKLPESAPMHSARALLLLAKNQLEPAEQSLAKADALDAEHYHVKYAHGRLLMEQCKYTAAEQAFRAATECAPAVVAPFCYMQVGTALVEQAKLEWSEETAQHAVNAFLRALEIMPQWEFGYCLAISNLKQHPDPEVPLSIAERGLVEFPASQAIPFVALNPLIRAGRLEDAEYVYTEALPLIKENVPALIALAETIAEFPPLYSYALNVLEFADSHNPNDVSIAQSFVLLHTAMGNAEQVARWKARVEELRQSLATF